MNITNFADYYLSSSLTFYDDKIICQSADWMGFNKEVMMDWEHPIMSASAAYITKNGGDILEIGFGMGISANYIQSHSISSHTIIENHPQIIEKLETWSNGKSNINIISQSWTDVQYETINVSPDTNKYYGGDIYYLPKLEL